jgi:hypothetical protein
VTELLNNSNPFQSDVLVIGATERDELVWLRQGSVAGNGGGAGPEPCAKWRQVERLQ